MTANMCQFNILYPSGTNHQNSKYTVNLSEASAKITFPIIRLLNNNRLDKSYVKIRNYKPSNW